MIRTYSELVMCNTFEEKFNYLKLNGNVGKETFGFDRYLNQRFYRSYEWKNARKIVIARDNGGDLGDVDRPISGRILVHHMNPISANDLDSGLEFIIDPEYLISVSHNTHNAIHYGDLELLPKQYIPRSPGDTKLW